MRAYLRTTMLERCRKVIVDWAALLAGESDSNVAEGPGWIVCGVIWALRRNTVEV
jgi:hypothetical protein